MVSQAGRETATASELKSALLSFRKGLIGVALFSAVVNILMLTGPIFMLQVYDRVLPSRSIPTLVVLAIVVAALYVFQGVMDVIRMRILNRIAGALDEAMTARVHQVILELPLRRGAGGDGLQPLRDLDQIRSFLSSNGPAAFFDLPWMPLYILVCAMFHPWIGITAAAGALLLFFITLATEILSRKPAQEAATQAAARSLHIQAMRRNAEAVHAMGMSNRLLGQWLETNDRFLQSHKKATDVIAGLGGIAKTIRFVLQSFVLGLGAYLVIEQASTPGIIIASSILVSRALAPVELAVANWKSFVAARQGWARLVEILRAIPKASQPLLLPVPQERFSAESIAVVAPGVQRVIVQDVTFRLNRGDGLGIIGPSGSGKSSLARVLVGVWRPVRGTIRLDGAALDQWSSEEAGRFIGYLPQEPGLFHGSIAQNISRFENEAEPGEIIAAAKAADAHDLILSFPDGYEMQIGENGGALSAGQKQRIALARALYRDPFLIVLDEPNSNLDEKGDQALMFAVSNARRRGAIVIVIAHRPSALAAIDQLLVLANGRQYMHGPKEEVMKKISAAAPLKVVTS